MTAATHAIKNAFVLTVSKIFGVHLRLYAIFISEQLTGQLVSGITNTVTSLPIASRARFSLTDCDGRAYGPDCSWATSSNQCQDKMDSYPSRATVVGMPAYRAINRFRQFVLAQPCGVKEDRA